jgi:hypothetical protein
MFLLWEDETPPPAKRVFRVECSWCKRLLAAGPPGALTSHSICPDCTSTYFPLTDTET